VGPAAGPVVMSHSWSLLHHWPCEHSSIGQGHPNYIKTISDQFLPAPRSCVDLQFELHTSRRYSDDIWILPYFPSLVPSRSPLPVNCLRSRPFSRTTPSPASCADVPSVCGSIRIVYDGTLQFKALCHCSDCRKISGSAYSTNLLVPASALRLESGQPRMYTKETDEGNRFTNFWTANDSGARGLSFSRRDVWRRWVVISRR